jgi:predicted MFS family arabinose efflux permease
VIRLVRNVVSMSTRLVGSSLGLVFASSFGSLTAFFLMLSVGPMEAGSTADAGLVTGVLLLGTVLAELGASVLGRRFGHRVVLAAGSLLLGLPSLALMSFGSLAVLVTASFARGVGFGLIGVVSGSLVAALLPPERRGEGLGLLGIVDGVPAVVALPTGIWLAHHCGYSAVAAMAGVIALLPLAAAILLPAPRTASPGDPGVRLLAGLRRPGLVRLALIFAAVTAADGIVASFLPIASSVAAAGLFASAVAATTTRWWAGRVGDSRGHDRLLAPALAVSFLGLVGLVLVNHPVMVIVALCLFGAGFGVIENTTFVLMLERMPASGTDVASAMWNLAYDTGYGAGPVAFGLFAAHSGYPIAFALTSALVLAALPAATRRRPSR